MKVPDSKAKKDWMRENTRVFAVKVMKRTESDLLEFLEKQERPSTTIKNALREYMKNHPEESEEK